MSLRKRVFLLIATLFISVFTIFGWIRNAQIDEAVLEARGDLAASIRRIDQEKRSNILEFVMINIAAMDNRMGALFEKIEEYQWLREKYAPSQFNYETNDWESASILMASNQWVDLVQTTARGKLTSLVMARPPYMNPCAKIQVNKQLTVILCYVKDVGYELFIGVPYWQISEGKGGKDSKGDVLKDLSLNQDNYLLFSLEQMLSIDPSALKPKTLQIPMSPLEPLVSVHSMQVYEKLISSAIAAIRKTKEALLKEKGLIEIFRSKEKTVEWAAKQGDFQLDSIVPKAFEKCSGYLCNELKEAHPLANWQQLEDWDERYEQNQLIWKLGSLIGSGIWDYNPLASNSPQGIVSFYTGELEKKRPNVGRGLLASEIFYNTPLVTNHCTPEENEGDFNYCVAPQLQIFTPAEGLSVYLTKTMTMVEKEKGVSFSGTMTIGVDINPMIQMLALAAPSEILFVSENGKIISFDGKSVVEAKEKWPQIEARQLVEQKTGSITNIHGEEFLFVHLTALTPGNGHVFLIDLKNNAYQMLGDLNERTNALVHRIFIEYFFITVISVVIVLLFLNHILKKAINPIQHLARVTKDVGAGDLEKIQISEEELERKDEVGVLCRAFMQMIEEMKHGEKIKAVLHKVVPKEIAEKILKEGIKLEGETREVTVLFSDIRNFTEIAEKMEPREVLHMLNDCLDILSRVIDEHSGVIDKYVGDEIMAIFGAPVDTENSALQAVLCAKMMRSTLNEWNEQRKLRSLPVLEIGIGIHTGSVVAGNVGGEKHLTYTILGHNVNLASRVCNHAAGMEILITEETLNAPFVRDKCKTEPLPPIQFKGISSPITLYRIL